MQGELGAQLSAYLKVGFGPFSVTKRFKLAEVTLLDFNFNCEEDMKDPILANKDGGVLMLNIGTRAEDRKFTNTEDGAENFTIKRGSDANSVIVEAFGFSQEYKNITEIRANAGKEDDIIQVESGVTAEVNFDGGEGDDSLRFLADDDGNFTGGDRLLCAAVWGTIPW